MSTEPKTCSRETCCTDNPGAEPTAACYNTAACGCQVVTHSAHPTPDFLAYIATSTTEGAKG